MRHSYSVALQHHEALQEIAKKEDRTLAWVIRQAFSAYINDYNEKHPETQEENTNAH